LADAILHNKNCIPLPHRTLQRAIEAGMGTGNIQQCKIAFAPADAFITKIIE
jgi:hypothetical protein